MPRILSIGQCGYDHRTLSQFLASRLHADVVAADDAEQARELVGREEFDLVLINRIFDMTAENGNELIEAWSRDPPRPGLKLMLVSNLRDAQQRAVAAGALPGFGKAELNDPSTLTALKTGLGLDR